MKKLKRIDGACAVVALLYVSGLSEDTVLRICRLHGFEDGRGMEDAEWKEAAQELGIKTRSVPVSPQRLRKFVHDHKEGLFLIGTHDHIFVLDAGLIVDPRNETPPGLGRIVQQAWRVG